MKKILTTSIILTSILSASPFYSLSDKVDELEKEVKDLKALLQKPSSKEIEQLKLKTEDNEAYTEEVEGNLDNLTAKVLKNNRVGFTRLKFDNTIHNFSYKMANGDKDSNRNVDTINLKMDLETKISPKLTFRGQLAMYKYWAQGMPYPYSTYDNMQGRVPSDTSLYVTRAYIDWKAISGNVPLTLTIGRQPSSSGPSWQYSNNGVRYGTYDALVFDGNADGIVATIGLDKVIPLNNSALRLAYGKGFQNNNFSSTQIDMNDNDVFGVFFENQIPKVKNSFMQTYYTIAKDIATSDTSVGDISWVGMMFELNNINKFDFFAHFSMSKSKPNGKVGTVQAGYPSMGLLTFTPNDTKSKTGNAMWIGMRYSFDSKAKLGLEYGKGSKNWINMTQGSDNILNPRSVRGDVVDVYGIYPIDKSLGVNAFIKLGATMIDYAYTGSGMPFGAPTKIDSNMANGNNTIDKINDFYLDFQVNY